MKNKKITSKTDILKEIRKEFNKLVIITKNKDVNMTKNGILFVFRLKEKELYMIVRQNNKQNTSILNKMTKDALSEILYWFKSLSNVIKQKNVYYKQQLASAKHAYNALVNTKTKKLTISDGKITYDKKEDKYLFTKKGNKESIPFEKIAISLLNEISEKLGY